MNPANQPLFVQPHGPGMFGPQRSDHPDPGFATRQLWLDGLSYEEWDEYMNGNSVQRNIERNYQTHKDDMDRHACLLRKRKGQTNAKYLTNSLQPYQTQEDDWVRHYQTHYSHSDQQALQSAKYTMRPTGGAPRSIMTPDVLFRRQMGGQARISKRKPVAKKPKTTKKAAKKPRKAHT